MQNLKLLTKKESYFVTELESWNTKEKFDVIFSMESLYYSVPMEPALEKVFKLLKKGGRFYCGTDFYSDNTLTTRWVKDMDIPMDLRSEKEWMTNVQRSWIHDSLKTCHRFQK